MLEFPEEYTWIKTGDKIFIDGKNPSTYAHYGWQFRDATAFEGYIEGYRLAAETLVEKALNAGAVHDIATIDTLVFPIVFLYRQFMELTIKSLFLNYSEKSHEEKTDFLRMVNHNLIKAWDYVKPIATEYASGKEDVESLKIAEQYIRQFHDFSKTSFEYRYPIYKNNKPVHKDQQYLDLKNLRDKMISYAHFYDGLSGQMSCMSDLKAEMLSEYMSYMDY